MIKVSIVIPVYHAEAYLPACLDSVLAQTLTDIEIICIDDASPDNCGRILDDYAARDARVKVLHLPENRQQGYGRNQGLGMARGEYVYFLDSDDMITPNAMEELYALAKEETLDGIFFDAQAVYESQALADKFTNEVLSHKGNYENRVYTGQELLDAFTRQNEWTCSPPRQFWSRAYLERESIRMPEGVLHEDEAFAFKAIMLAKRARYVRKTYFIRRYRENSVMTSPYSPQDFYGYFVAYCAMDQFVHERRVPCEAADRVLAQIYDRMVRLYELLAEKEDLESWFKTQEERHLYYFFQSARKSELHYYFMKRELKDALKQYRHIYVYGAGKVARTLAKRLYYGGFFVDRFVVTSKAGNPGEMFGRPVISIDELRLERDGIVIVAAAPALQKEIVPLLAERRFRYVIHNSGEVVSFD